MLGLCRSVMRPGCGGRLKNIHKLLSASSPVQQRNFSTNHVLRVAGVDDNLFGLTEEQMEFRQAIHDFCKKELAPYAAQIDRDNGWDQLR